MQRGRSMRVAHGNWDRGQLSTLELLETKFANGWLKDSPFLAGDAPTIADFRFGPVLLFARVAVKLPERVEAYVARLERDVPGYAEATEPARAFVADKIKK